MTSEFIFVIVMSIGAVFAISQVVLVLVGVRHCARLYSRAFIDIPDKRKGYDADSRLMQSGSLGAGYIIGVVLTFVATHLDGPFRFIAHGALIGMLVLACVTFAISTAVQIMRLGIVKL